MPSMTTGEKVRRLVCNLASDWNGGRVVLGALMEAAGGRAASPYDAYRQLEESELTRLFGRGKQREELNRAVEQLEAYLGGETWFDRTARDDARLQALRGRPVAYFCAEYGLIDWLPIYSGGLGVLAGDVLKEASDQGLPLVGVGLFYRHGFFSQRVDAEGSQSEVYPTLDPTSLPLQAARNEAGEAVVIDIPMADGTVYATIWKLQIGRTMLYLLDTDTPQNQREEDRAITANLYGGDSETRIRQEIVLGIGGVRALRALGIGPMVYGMNEGHAAFLGVELMAQAQSEGDFSRALESVRKRVVYTNHTVVPAGNDIFPADLVRVYLGPYAQSRGVDLDRLVHLGADGGDQISMAILAFRLSGKANAVSHIHLEAIHDAWPGFAVEEVTNGVHLPTWVGPEIAALLDRYVPAWRDSSPRWEGIYGIPPVELWRAHVAQRWNLIDFVSREAANDGLNRDALTVVWARRFAEYKRADLIARDIGRLQRLMSNPGRPVQLVISGKAHPRDEGAKRMMRELLTRLRSDPAIAPHFAFLPDYRIGIAHRLTAGADIWLNTPRKPLEASGTSGMKSSDNGGLQLTVCDGWAAEVDWWDVGWGIEGRNDENDAELLYTFLEDSIVPTFYDRDAEDVPQKWVTMMKNTLIITLSRYSATRMLHEYLYKLYLPLVEEQTGTSVKV